MKWSPSLGGAVLVIVCGFLVGALIGSKRTTRVVTKTIRTGVDTASLQVQYLAAMPSANVPSSNMTVDTSTKVAQIGSSTYSEALLLNPFLNASTSAQATFVVRSPRLQRLLATVGEIGGESAKTDVTVDIRARSEKGSLLATPLRVNHAGPYPLDVALHGVRIVSVVITDNTCAVRCRGTRGPIILGNARFVP